MTKVEQLKAKTYAIEILESKIEENEEIIKWNSSPSDGETGEYQKREIERAKDNIEKIKFIMEEISK